MAATNKSDIVSIEDLPNVGRLAELLGPDHKQRSPRRCARWSA
jgi:hypothetical protein